MRSIIFIAFLIFLMLTVSDIALAGKPTAVVDTVSINAISKAPAHFIARWTITVGTTPDTLLIPYYGSIVEVLHQGAAAGDTLDISYVQPSPAKVAKYGDILYAKDEVVYRDFGDAVIRQIIVKGRTSFTATIRIIN